jgi:hypothetical protein
VNSPQTKVENWSELTCLCKRNRQPRQCIRSRKKTGGLKVSVPSDHASGSESLMSVLIQVIRQKEKRLRRRRFLLERPRTERPSVSRIFSGHIGSLVASTEKHASGSESLMSVLIQVIRQKEKRLRRQLPRLGRRANSAGRDSGSVVNSPQTKVENWSELTCLCKRNRQPSEGEKTSPPTSEVGTPSKANAVLSRPNTLPRLHWRFCRSRFGFSRE